jgi:predicted aspartyl protease
MKAKRATCGAIAPLVLFVLAAANAATPVERLNLGDYQGLQLERGSQNHLVLHVTVNGRPASLIVDTGARTSFLRTDRVRTLGLISSGTELSDGSSVSVELRATPKLFGKVTMDLYDPSKRARYLPADGTIGLDLLRRYQALINCRTRQIFFRTAGTRLLDVSRTAAANGLVKVPMQETPRGYLRISCSIHGKIGKLLLDTGAFVTVLEQRAVYALGISGSDFGMRAGGFDGQVRSLQLAQINDLKIGTVAIPPQRLVLMNIIPERESRKSLMIGFMRVAATEDWGMSSEPFFGLLGNDLLDYQYAIIDLGTMSLFLKSGGAAQDRHQRIPKRR